MLKHRCQRVRNLPAACGHVDMGIGVVADQHVRVVDHRLAQISVAVEGGDQGDGFRQSLAQPSQDLTVRIVDPIGDGCSM